MHRSTPGPKSAQSPPLLATGLGGTSNNTRVDHALHVIRYTIIVVVLVIVAVIIMEFLGRKIALVAGNVVFLVSMSTVSCGCHD